VEIDGERRAKRFSLVAHGIAVMEPPAHPCLARQPAD
jgi:hypothetical protein